MTDFGEMYANFLYTDANGGTMELPLVRGSGMLTHLFTDAIPVVKPYCLNAINAVPATFECPEEESGESMKILLLLVLLRNPKEDIADTII